MKPPGARKTQSRHVGAFEDNKLGKAREREAVRVELEDECGEICRLREAIYPACPTCGLADMVEDSVSPEKFAGYCYRCGTPFVAQAVRKEPKP